MRRFRLFALPVIAFLLPACAINNGPRNMIPPPQERVREPVLRVGEISETLTGSWTEDPSIGTSAFRSAMIDALKLPEVAARFSPDSSNLIVNIDLTSDHESDLPRLSNLGGLSILTLGLVPLNYNSEWDVDCRVNVLAHDGTPVADYIFQERGTYKIWALPPTMFTLLGAGIRGDQDARTIYRLVTTSLAYKLADAADRDYDKFAARVRPSAPPVAETPETEAPLRPLIP